MSHFKKIPIAFICFLLIIIVTEMYFRSISKSVMALSDTVITYKLRILKDSDNRNKYNAIIMGDSRLLGMDANYISKELTNVVRENFNIYNHSLPQSDVRSFYVYLKKYLKYNKAPKYIFFSTVDGLYFGDDNFELKNKSMTTSMHRLCLISSIGDIFEVFDLKEVQKVVVAKIERLVFFVTYRTMIKNQIKDETLFEGESQKDMVYERMNGGVEFAFKKAEGLTEEQLSVLRSDKFEVDQKSIYWIEKFIKLAGKHNAKVLIFDAPLREEIFKIKVDSGRHDKYVAIIDELAGRNDNCTYVGNMPKVFQEDVFIDARHLNGIGFNQFNREFVNIIGDYLNKNN